MKRETEEKVMGKRVISEIRPPFILLVVMMMAPQILETLYSPALTNISEFYRVSAEMASQTISIYFFAFALGVFIWGVAADYCGRRVAMLAGLSLYMIGAFFALLSTTYTLLLMARILIAFGVAVGSVITQTVMRDCYADDRLGNAFATMGVALSLSPIIGMVAGGVLVSYGGVKTVFCGQFGFALLLFLWCFFKLPETQVKTGSGAIFKKDAVHLNDQQNVESERVYQRRWKELLSDLISLFKRMMMDRHIILTIILIALFNIMVFSYYSLAPFIFEELGLDQRAFGISGLVLTLGTIIGSLLNKHLIYHGIEATKQLSIGITLVIIAAFLFYLFRQSLWFLLPSGLIMLSFGLAIPTLLSHALHQYQAELGSAGAILGICYYLLIGIGLTVVAEIQILWLVIAISALLGLITIFLVWYINIALAK